MTPCALFYDTSGRLKNLSSRWDGTAFGATDTVTYYNGTKYLNTQTTAGILTTYGYSWGVDSRTVSITDSAGTSYAVYNDLDLLWRTYGSGATPSEKLYDSVGRLGSLTTWTTAGFEGSSWPTTPGSGNTTTWTIEAATGLVTSKSFADASHVDFTYTVLGQPATRTSARGIITAYSYNDGSVVGTSPTQELNSITYSDSTPSVVFSYKRSGLPAGIADWTGNRTFDYGTTNPFQLAKENLSSYYGSRLRTAEYDGQGRGIGFKIGTSANDSADLEQAGGYVAASGLLDHMGTASNSGTVRTITYGYLTGASLVSNYYVGATAMTDFAMTYDYDATSAARRNLVQGQYKGSAVTRFDLAYNDRGFTSTAKQSGSAFADYTTGTTYTAVNNQYLYDARGR
jgi:hypothetical protein